MGRTDQIEVILSNEEYKNKLIKDFFGREEIDEAGALAANPEEHLIEHLEKMDEESFKKIFREFEYYSSSRNDGDSVNTDKEQELKALSSIPSTGVKPGITVGSTSGFENGLTGGLDCPQEETDVVVDDRDNVDIDVNGDGDGYQVVDNSNVRVDDNTLVDNNNIPVEDNGEGDNSNLGVAEISDTGSLNPVASTRSAQLHNSSAQLQADYPPHLSRCTIPCQPHICRPVCETCQTPMNISIVEILFQQNLTLTTRNTLLHRRILKSSEKITEQEKKIDRYERKLNEYVQKLQQGKHDYEELYKILTYFRKVMAKRKEENEKLEKEIQLLNNKLKVIGNAEEMENAISASLNDLPQHMGQVTEMIENLMEENRKLKVENKELRERSKEERSALEAQNADLTEENESLRTELECVTENAITEDELYVRRLSEIEHHINEEARQLREAYSCLQTFAIRHGLPLPLGSAEPQDEMDD